MSQLSELLKFRRKREGIPAQARPKRNRLFRLWSMWRVPEEDLDRLRSLISSGNRLEELQRQAAWNDVLEAKAYYQSLFDQVSKTVSTPEKERLKALDSWATLEGFFKEIEHRIKRGQEARTQLEAILGNKP